MDGTRCVVEIQVAATKKAEDITCKLNSLRGLRNLSTYCNEGKTCKSLVVPNFSCSRTR